MENSRQARTGERSTTQSDPLIPLMRRCLEEMSNTQALLSSTRKELLIERERVKTAGREVRQKRDDAGNAEVKFMNSLREFANNHLEQLPTTLLDAYEKVEKTRDDLGEAEENYLQAEGSLTGAEWTFMNREDRFYQFDVNRILLDPHFDDHAPLYGQPLVNPSHPPAYQLPPCPAGSLSPSQVSKLPPPPPPPPLSPPHLSPAPRVPIAPSSSAPIGQEYAAMVAEVDTLKKELGRSWKKQSYDLASARGDEALFAEGNGIIETDVTACRSEHSDIIFDIPNPEAKAERSKMGEMDLALATSTLTRRCSDSTYSSRTAPRLSVPMRRAQTESVALFNRCSPDITKKIRDWSLTHLKESVIQKRLYLNTLQDNGIESPVGNEWELRATEFWSKDSLNESRDSSEPYAASASRTGHEVRSCNDRSVTPSITSSLLMQHRLEGNLQPSHEMTADLRSPGTHEGLQQSCEDGMPVAPLSPSPSPDDHIADEAEIKNGDRTVNPVVDVLDDQQHVAEDELLADAVVDRPKCTCFAESGDAALRKDSVHSTHQPNCAMTVKHGHQDEACSSAQEQNHVEMKTKNTTLSDHCDPTCQNQLVDLHLPLPSNSYYEQSARAQSDFDTTAHSTSPSPCAQLPTPSALVIKEKPQYIESPVKANCRPISQGRRGTTSWVRSVLSPFKNLRSKSTPSIGEHYPAGQT